MFKTTQQKSTAAHCHAKIYLKKVNDGTLFKITQKKSTTAHLPYLKIIGKTSTPAHGHARKLYRRHQQQHIVTPKIYNTT